MENEYIIEMLNITKEFPGIKANDNITLQLKKGEIHALLGENGAGKSTLMSILFGLYQPTSGIIKKNGQEVHINTPNDANDLNIGMVHQHFKLVECFSVLDNIILGVEPTKGLFLEKKNARAKVMELSEKYGLMVDPDALISDITVGMQQRTEILKMLYRDNEVLIFDDDDNAEVLRGREHRRACADDHPCSAGFYLLEAVIPLTGGQRRVQNRDFFAKPGGKLPQKLRRQSNFGHEHNGALSTTYS